MDRVRATLAKLPWGALLAFGAPLAAYWRTLAPTVFGLDSAEFSSGAAALGLVHPPGYPLYLLLGHLFVRLPLGGDAGYRLNLMSAFFAALTSLFLYLLLSRLTRRRLSALLAALMLAFSYYFWNQALVAEIYTLNTFLITLTLYLFARWWDQRRPAWLVLAALVFGLALANRPAIALLGPGLAVWFIHHGGLRLPRRWWLAGAAGFLLGLSVYLYLPLRYLADPALNYVGWYFDVDLTTPAGLWWMFSARMFRPLAFAYPISQLPGQVVAFLAYLAQNFLGVGVLLGIWGMWQDWKRRPWLHTGLALLFGLPAVFYINYRVLDKVTMFLPVFMIWSIWIGLGVDAVWEFIERLGGEAAESKQTRRQVEVVLVLLVVGLVWLNAPRVDMSQARDARQRGEQIFATLPPNSSFFGTWADTPILEYLQIVEGQRPDVQLHNVFLMPQDEAILAAWAASASDRAYAGGLYRILEPGDLSPIYIPDCDCYALQARFN